MSRNFTVMMRSGLYNCKLTRAFVDPAGAIALGVITKRGTLGKTVSGVKYIRDLAFMDGARGVVIEASGEYHRRPFEDEVGHYTVKCVVTRIFDTKEKVFSYEKTFKSNNIDSWVHMNTAMREAFNAAGISEAVLCNMKEIPLFSGAHLAKEA